MQDRVDRLPVCECIVNKTNVATGCRRVEFETGNWKWVKRRWVIIERQGNDGDDRDGINWEHTNVMWVKEGSCQRPLHGDESEV